MSAGGLIAVLFVVGQLLAAVSQMGEYPKRAAETATGVKRIAAYWEAVDAVATISDGLARRIVSKGVPAERVYVVRNSVHAE